LWERTQLLIEQAACFSPINVGGSFLDGWSGGNDGAPARLAHPSGHAGRDAVQPRTDRLSLDDGAGAASEDEKSGLEGVFDLVSAAEQTPADAEDHRTVPSQECGEGRLVARVGEAADQRFVGGGVIGQPTVELLQQEGCVRNAHGASLPDGIDFPS
jgi:hypothetical protein